MARQGSGVYDRGGSWWLDFRHQGQRHIVKIGANIKRSVAVELAGVQRVRILRGELGIGPKKRRDSLFETAKEEFLKWADTNKKPNTARCYRQYLEELEGSFRGKRLSQICRLDVERHKRTRIEAGARVRANREVSALKNFYNRCREWGLYEGENPVIGIKLLKEPQQRLRYLEYEEEARLLAHCTEPLRSLLVVAINTGLRIESEALALKWRDVDLHRKLLSVPAAYAKSGKTRTIPLNSRAVSALERLKAGALSEYVFHDKVGEPYYSMLDKPFAAALKAAGLANTGITPHVMRHTFASRLVMAGVDLRTVQELGGWSDLSLVQRYSHLAPLHKSQAVEKIAAAFPDAMPKPAEHALDKKPVSMRKSRHAPVAQLDRAAVS